MSTVLVSEASPPQGDLIRAEQSLHANYILFAGYTFLVLEHLDSFAKELEVWKSSWNVAKAFFLLYRYSAIAGLALVLHVASGITKNLDTTYTYQLCKHIVASMVVMAVLSMAIADAMVMLRVSVLWRRQRTVLIILSLSFAVSCVITVACAVLTSTKLLGRTSVSRHSNKECLVRGKPAIVLGVWIPGMAFDSLVLILTCYNVLSRPRSQSRALTYAMYQDGILFFLILAALRLGNFMVAIFSRQFLIGVCIAWALSAVTLNRFIFHLRNIESQSHGPPTSKQIVDDEMHSQRGPLLQMQQLTGEDSQSQRSKASTMTGSQFPG